jgi:hypothetical protein
VASTRWHYNFCQMYICIYRHFSAIWEMENDEGTERIILCFVNSSVLTDSGLRLLLLYPGVETLLPVMDGERLLVEFFCAVQDLDCEVLDGRVDVRVSAGEPQRLGGLPVTADADGRR